MNVLGTGYVKCMQVKESTERERQKERGEENEKKAGKNEHVNDRGRRRRRSREAECFHLVGNPVRLPPPDGTHWPSSPTPQPGV